MGILIALYEWMHLYLARKLNLYFFLNFSRKILSQDRFASELFQRFEEEIIPIL